MSYAAENDHSDERWFQNIRFWRIALLFILLSIGLVILIDASWNPISDLDGGFTIEADPDTRIYVGDRLVGTSSVAFSWGELFGDEKHSGFALEMSDPDQPITAEMLSGPNATIVLEEFSMRIGGTGDVRAHIIRTVDGALDPVFALILEWTPPNQSPGRYLLPIRLRQGPTPSASYFKLTGGATTGDWHPRIMKVFFQSVNETTTKWSFTATDPPSQFADEIKANGLWEPAGAK